MYTYSTISLCKLVYVKKYTNKNSGHYLWMVSSRDETVVYFICIVSKFSISMFYFYVQEEITRVIKQEQQKNTKGRLTSLSTNRIKPNTSTVKWHFIQLAYNCPFSFSGQWNFSFPLHRHDKLHPCYANLLRCACSLMSYL